MLPNINMPHTEAETASKVLPLGMVGNMTSNHVCWGHCGGLVAYRRNTYIHTYPVQFIVYDYA